MPAATRWRLTPSGNPLATDMLGRARIVGTAVDIGAVELPAMAQLIVASPLDVEVIEGGYVRIEVKLSAPPLGTVLVSVHEQSDDGGASMGLVFDATNWDTPQTVTIVAPEDADRDNESIVFRFEADGMDPVTLSVLVRDNDFQTYVVDSLSDDVAADGRLTLREALEAANTNTAVADAPEGCEGLADVITFSPALFTDGVEPVSGTIALGGRRARRARRRRNPRAGSRSLGDRRRRPQPRVLRGPRRRRHDRRAGDHRRLRRQRRRRLRRRLRPVGSQQRHRLGQRRGRRRRRRVQPAPAELTLTDSTFSGNSARRLRRLRHSRSTARALAPRTDSTVSGNSARGDGGGIYDSDGHGTVDRHGSTLSDNSAGNNGGGIYTRAARSPSPTRPSRTTRPMTTAAGSTTRTAR